MASNFKINGVDTDNLFVRKDLFYQGGLWGIGQGEFGKLGNNSTSDQDSPVSTVPTSSNWKTVAALTDHAAAIKTDGSLWVWGLNGSGQLGNNAITHRSTPVQTVAGGFDWKQVACADRQTAAIKQDGSLWTWGRNNDGELGDGTTTDRSSPVQTAAGGNDWKQVACSFESMAAIKMDGTLWLWGHNSYGQVCQNDTDSRSSPTQIFGGGNWKYVAGNGNHLGAIKSDGTLWMWGLNAAGNLGDGTTLEKSSPVQVSGGGSWKFVACGRYHTVAIKSDGSLWSWGENSVGQLGDNSNTSRSSPVQNAAGGYNWRLVACGYYHTVALKHDGTLWSWGDNAEGALGETDLLPRSSPIQGANLSGTWSAIAASKETTYAIRERY